MRRKEGIKMEKVMDVANWFLSQDAMTHKKLQKLCYYAQAWHCALHNGKPLFSEPIEAWVHGPVIRDLYGCFAGYGWDEIPQRSGTTNFSDKALEVLEAVYSTYGDFNGDQLEYMTHQETPWLLARGDLKPWEPCTEQITVQSMQEYYARRYAESQND